MNLTKNRPTTIEEYIEAVQPEARSHLRQMYQILKRVAPAGTEAIKWGVPVFWDKQVLFGFAAYKAHLSFGPGPAATERFSRELAGYKYGKGTIQFPYDQTLPEKLISDIAGYCIRESNKNET